MSLPVEALKRHSLAIWRASSPETPDLGALYREEEQVRKEQEIDLLMDEVDLSVRSIQPRPKDAKEHLIAVRSRVQKSMIQLLHTFGCVVDTDMEMNFSKSTDEFIRRAYEFDPEISQEAVYQASRNVLIMNTVQMHLGMDIAVTPSVFAYSMIYPYTDNYLDTKETTPQEKRDFNRWLRLRLAGTGSSPRSRREEIIDALVELIEGEFGRAAFPHVYDSLLAIHSAQSRSVSQHSTEGEIGDEELTDISFEKGGTSVLADGYLVAGELSPEDAHFLFRFGVLLQLIDDLQDIEEDSSAGQTTLAVVAARKGLAEEYTNLLFSFGNGVLDPARLRQERLHVLIDRSCRLLILEAVAANHGYYGATYCNLLESHSPVSLRYLRCVKDRLQRAREAHQNKVGHALRAPLDSRTASGSTEAGRPALSTHQRHLLNAYKRLSSNSLLGIS